MLRGDHRLWPAAQPTWFYILAQSDSLVRQLEASDLNPLNNLSFVSEKCVRVCSVAQLCVTLCDPIRCSLPGSVCGILQARILEWVAIFSFRGFSWHRDQTRVSCISCIGRQLLYHWATGEAPCLKSKGILYFYYRIIVNIDKMIAVLPSTMPYKNHPRKVHWMVEWSL